jgi:signal transduction histidine kinase
MLTNPNRTLLLRLAQLGALAAMAVLGLFDVAQNLLHGGTLLALIRVLMAMAAAAVWLPAHRQNSTSLPKVAAALGLASLLLTGVVAGSQYPGGASGSWGLAESAALLGVLFVVARRATPGWGAVAVIFVGAAVSFLPLRGGETAAFVIFGLIQALAGSGAIGLGIYLRMIEGARLRAFDAVRAEQRAEFARDLHDFIAHHVTGIVVQAQGAKFIA